jgi:hypothetical protein
LYLKIGGFLLDHGRVINGKQLSIKQQKHSAIIKKLFLENNKHSLFDWLIRTTFNVTAEQNASFMIDFQPSHQFQFISKTLCCISNFEVVSTDEAEKSCFFEFKSVRLLGRCKFYKRELILVKPQQTKLALTFALMSASH